MKNIISTRIGDDLMKKLEQISEKEEHSVSFLVRKAVIAFIKEKEKDSSEDSS